MKPRVSVITLGVDDLERAGAALVKPTHDTFWGSYAGYFQDPDGHLCEAVWNPQWTG